MNVVKCRSLFKIFQRFLLKFGLNCSQLMIVLSLNFGLGPLFSFGEVENKEQ